MCVQVDLNIESETFLKDYRITKWLLLGVHLIQTQDSLQSKIDHSAEIMSRVTYSNSASSS